MNSKQYLLDSMQANYQAWYIPFWKSTWFYIGAGICILVCLVGVLYGIYYFFIASRKTELERMQEHLYSALQHSVATVQELRQGYQLLTDALKKYVLYVYKEDISWATEDQMGEFLLSLDHAKYLQVPAMIRRAQHSKYAFQELVIQEEAEQLYADLQFVLVCIKEHNTAVQKK